jgi:hypothetical protein
LDTKQLKGYSLSCGLSDQDYFHEKISWGLKGGYQRIPF